MQEFGGDVGESFGSGTHRDHGLPLAYLFHVHEYVVPSNLNGVAIHSYCGVLNHFAGRHVVLPGVPRAGHDLTIELAFAERAAFMRAYAIDSAELTGHIGNRYGLPSHLELVNLPQGDVLFSSCAHESHASPLFQFVVVCLWLAGPAA